MNQEWKRALPAELFAVSGNGLVMPRYFSRPPFASLLAGLILNLVILIFVFDPYLLKGKEYFPPEAKHADFQFATHYNLLNPRPYFVVVTMGEAYGQLLVSDKHVVLGAEFVRRLKREMRLRERTVDFSGLSHFQRYFLRQWGYPGNPKKLYLCIEPDTRWGRVCRVLQAAGMAGIRDVCFLTSNSHDDES